MCKVVLIATVFFIIYLCSITAIKCPVCDDIFIDKNNASLPGNKSHCQETELTAECTSELFVDLNDPYPAIIRYITASSNDLITSNGDSKLIQTIKIPFDSTGFPSGSVISECYDKDLCNNHIIQEQYKQLYALNCTKLTTELSELLYNDQHVVDERPIECYNRNNRIAKCPIKVNCQATLIIEEGRSDLLTTSYIRHRSPSSIAGLIFRKESIGNNYNKITISYICNKNKCNDPDIVQKIRQLFVDVNLVNSKANNLKFLSIVLSFICIIANICIR